MRLSMALRMSGPFFSIVIPTCNRASRIRTSMYPSLCGQRTDSLRFLARILRRHPEAIFTRRFAATVKHLVG